MKKSNFLLSAFCVVTGIVAVSCEKLRNISESMTGGNIQSVVFVPEYSGNMTVASYSVENGTKAFTDLVLDYEVSPSGNAAASVVQAFKSDNSAVTIYCRDVKTLSKSSLSSPLNVRNVYLKNEGGNIISVEIDAKSLNEDAVKDVLLSPDNDLAVRLHIVFGSNDIFSDYSYITTDVATQEDLLSGTQGILKITDGIGDNTSAFITKDGYFGYKERYTTDSSSGFSSVSFMKADESDIITILASMTGKIPIEIVTASGIFYFSFLNENTMEVVFDNGDKVSYLGEISYSRSNLPSLNGLFASDSFKAVLANLVSLLKGVDYPEISGYITIFEEICGMPYNDNPDVADNLNKGENGEFNFVNKFVEWLDGQVKVVETSLSIWTGKASFKVGGSSCTLSGSIWCATDDYNKYGTYGILCDTNPANLELGKAEFENVGHQISADLGFEVDFRGFKPKTKYYYRAYYKFNGPDHGHLVAMHSNDNSDIIYDSVIKSFETGENILTVDVTMCIDVTGSMSRIINTVKNNAIGFYDAFKACCDRNLIGLSGLNVRVVAFRDINADGADWLQTSPSYSLPAEKTLFRNFVNGLVADGGGDGPESGLEALDDAFCNTPWSVDDGYHRQVTILWTDAPYLVGSSYTKLTVDDMEDKWNSLPSGRRLIIFAPDGGYGSNGAGWENLEGWKNCIHETDISSGFNDFEYILESIINELTGKGAMTTKSGMKKASSAPICFAPNN